MLRDLFTRIWNARHLGGGKLRIAVALVMVVAAALLNWLMDTATGLIWAARGGE